MSLGNKGAQKRAFVVLIARSPKKLPRYVPKVSARGWTPSRQHVYPCVPPMADKPDKPVPPLEKRFPELRKIREASQAKYQAEKEAREAAQRAEKEAREKQAAQAVADADLRERRAEKFRQEQAGMLRGGEAPVDTPSRVCLAVTVHFLRDREKESLDAQSRRLGVSAATLQHYAEWGEALEKVKGWQWMLGILFWLLDDPRGKLPDLEGVNRSATIREAEALKKQPSAKPRFEESLTNFQTALGELLDAYVAEGHPSRVSTIPELEAIAKLLSITHDYTLSCIEDLKAAGGGESDPSGDLPR